MLHGSRDTFAIEWHLEDRDDRLMPGKMCYWLGGETVGNAQARVYLADVLLSLAYPLGDCGRRHSDRFCDLPGNEAYQQLFLGLFEADESFALLVENESWARFDIGMPVSTFDGWHIYLVDCKTYSRFFVGGRLDGTQQSSFRREQRLELEVFDRTIHDFREHLNAIWVAFCGP